MMNYLAPGALDAAHDDAAHQKELNAFVEKLKTADDGWRQCVQHILATPNLDLRSEFLCLQVVEHYLSKQYVKIATRQTVSQDDVSVLRSLMANWMQRLSQRNDMPAALRNKMAQVFALIFVADYLTHWTNFFEEVFFAHIESSSAIADFYLRTLLEIDREIATQGSLRTQEEHERAAQIRDAMRERCLSAVVKHVEDVLRNSATATKTQELGYEVIGALILWIPVQLVANESTMALIVGSGLASANNEVHQAAADALAALMTKGMPPVEKRMLIQGVDGLLGAHSAWAPMYASEDECDEERAADMANLVNVATQQLCNIHSDLTKTKPVNDAECVETRRLIAERMPALLTCLGHSSILVSQSVTDSARDYVQLLKLCKQQMKTLDAQQTEQLQQMLTVTTRRYRLPPECVDNTDDDDEFMEYRRELRPVLINLGQLDSDLFIEHVRQYAEQTFANWRQCDVATVELAMSILYVSGEAVTRNVGSLLSGNDTISEHFKCALRAFLMSGVATECTASCVCLVAHELIVRYDKLFGHVGAEEVRSLLLAALSCLLGPTGINHHSPQVRSRATYQFSRFVKLQKSLVAAYVGDVLAHVAPLLGVHIPDDASSGNDLITADDKMFLYEAVGTLIVMGDFALEQKHAYMQTLIGDLAEKFARCVDMYEKTTDEKRRTLYAEAAKLTIAYAARITKAFADARAMKAANCDAIFLQLLKQFGTRLNERTAVLAPSFRQYVNRMVVCLEDELLPSMDVIFNALLQLSTDTRNLQDLLTLMHQTITKYKTRIIGYIEVTTIMHFVAAVEQLSVQIQQTPQADSVTGVVEDTYFELRSVRRAYVAMVNAIVKEAHEMLMTLGAENRERMLTSVCAIAADATDPSGAKAAMSCLRELVVKAQRMRDATAILPPKAEDAAKKTAAELEQLHAQMYADWLPTFVANNMVHAALSAVLHREFDVSDAQCMILSAECTQLLFACQKYLGDDFDALIRQRYLANAPDDTVAQLLVLLKQTALPAKELQKVARTVYGQLQRYHYGS